jgi:hypothetical protein
MMEKYLAIVVVLLGVVTGCGSPVLAHIGYTDTNKVVYHWVHPDGRHTIIVCNVLPNGSEKDCVESEV